MQVFMFYLKTSMIFILHHILRVERFKNAEAFWMVWIPLYHFLRWLFLSHQLYFSTSTSWQPLSSLSKILHILEHIGLSPDSIDLCFFSPQWNKMVSRFIKRIVTSSFINSLNPFRLSPLQNVPWLRLQTTHTTDNALCSFSAHLC